MRLAACRLIQWSPQRVRRISARTHAPEPASCPQVLWDGLLSRTGAGRVADIVGYWRVALRVRRREHEASNRYLARCCRSTRVLEAWGRSLRALQRLHLFLEFASEQQHASIARETANANVGPDARDFPLEPATGMSLAQHHSVANLHIGERPFSHSETMRGLDRQCSALMIDNTSSTA